MLGFADVSGNDVIFGRRDINGVENILNLKYSFSDKMNINTRVTSLLEWVRYKEFFTLQQDGGLAKEYRLQWRCESKLQRL